MWPFKNSAETVGALPPITDEVAIGRADNLESLFDNNLIETELVVRHPATALAVERRISAISQVPVVVTKPDGSDLTASNTVGIALATLDWYTIFAQIEADMSIYGNSFVRWSGRANSLTTKFEVLDASKITRDKEGIKQGKEILTDVIQFRRFLGDSYMGLSPLITLADSVLLGLYNRKANKLSEKSSSTLSRRVFSIFNRRPSGSPPSKDYLDSAATWYNKSTPKGAIAVPYEFKETILGKIQDPEFIAKQTWVVQEVARALSVPSLLLEDMSHSTYNVDRTRIKEWYAGPIESRLQLYEQKLRPLTLPLGFVIRFDRSQVSEFQEDISTQVDNVVKLVTADVWTVDRANEYLDQIMQ